MLADDTVRLLRFIKAGSDPNDGLGKAGAEMAERFNSLPMALKIAIPALALPAAVVGGIVLAPIEVGIGALVAIGGASAVLAGTAGAVSAQPESNGTKDLTVLPMVEASNFRVINERPVREDIIYATHPLNDQLLIPARKLHAFVAEEIVHAISAYAASKVRIKTMAIAIKSSKSGKVFVGGKLSEVPVGLEVSGGSHRGYAYNASYREPPKIRPLDTCPIWMDAFPALRGTFDRKGVGTIHQSERQDMGFNIRAEAAKVAGINLDWLSEFDIQVDAEFVR